MKFLSYRWLGLLRKQNPVIKFFLCLKLLIYYATKCQWPLDNWRRSKESEWKAHILFEISWVNTSLDIGVGSWTIMTVAAVEYLVRGKCQRKQSSDAKRRKRCQNKRNRLLPSGQTSVWNFRGEFSKKERLQTLWRIF